MSAISPSFNLPEGGIFRLPDCITAFIKTLSEGLPGTTAGPRVPPLSRFSRLSSRNPPIPAAVEWQALALTREQGPYVGFEECGSVFLGIGKGRHRHRTAKAKAKAIEERGVFHIRLGRFYHCKKRLRW